MNTTKFIVEAIGFVFAVSWATCFFVAVFKGKPWLAMAGLFAYPLGKHFDFAVVLVLLDFYGAVTLARPDSRWARKFYGSEKMARALREFPKVAERMKPSATGSKIE